MSGKPEGAVFRRGVRIIGAYIRVHPLPFVAAVTGAAVYALATVGSTLVLGWVTDHLLVSAFRGRYSARTALGAGLVVLAVAVLKAGGIMTRRFCAGVTRSRNEASLRTALVDRYQSLPLAWHQSRPTGELLSHAEADVVAATEVLAAVPYTLAVLFLLLFAGVEMIVTDPFLAAVGLAVLPALGVFNRLYSRRIEGPSTAVQERLGQLSALAHESFDGALVVKTLGREGDEVRRLADRADRLREARTEVGHLRATYEPALDALPNIGIILLLGVGSWRVSRGAISAGTLVQLASLFGLLALPVRMIGYVLTDLPRSVVSRERIQEVLDQVDTLGRPALPRPLPDGPVSLEVHSVGFSHRPAGTPSPAPVLDGLSFGLAPGASVALVGPTGSGKSTLASLLVRLIDPDRGSIRLGGVDLQQVDQADLRRAAAIVFQESFLFASTVSHNIALGSPVGAGEIRRAARLAQAEEFIVRLPDGYDTVVGERGLSLSGGQRQRIALARALVRRPRLLILDDATSAVDPTVEADILAGLRSGLDTTLVVVAYRISTIALADQVLYLDGGRIGAVGTHAELLDDPGYRSLVRAYSESGT